MKKNWNGNIKSTWATLGASNHSNSDREINDFYATDPVSIDELFKKEEFNNNILEPCCGNGHLSDRMSKFNKNVYSSDIVERKFNCHIRDFLNDDFSEFINKDFDIITNPPYKYALEFIKKSLLIIKKGGKVAMFLKLTFLEGQKRRLFFEQNPPKSIYVFSKRITCAINGDEEMFKKSSAACYAWFVWEKGSKSLPVINWIN